MKTERVTLLTRPDFKAYLGAEAAREGLSVAALVRSRCERKPDADEAMLAALGAIREALKLADDVKRSGEMLKELSKEVRIELRDHDRRITRLEAQWQTALDLRAGPRRIEGS